MSRRVRIAAADYSPSARGAAQGGMNVKSRMSYSNGAVVDLEALEQSLLKTARANSKERPRILEAVESGAIIETALQMFRANVANGRSEVEAHEVYAFVSGVFARFNLVPPSEVHVMEVLERFVGGGKGALDTADCLCLVDATFRATFRTDRSDTGEGEAEALRADALRDAPRRAQAVLEAAAQLRAASGVLKDAEVQAALLDEKVIAAAPLALAASASRFLDRYFAGDAKRRNIVGHGAPPRHTALDRAKLGEVGRVAAEALRCSEALANAGVHCSPLSGSALVQRKVHLEARIAALRSLQALAAKAHCRDRRAVEADIATLRMRSRAVAAGPAGWGSLGAMEVEERSPRRSMGDVANDTSLSMVFAERSMVIDETHGHLRPAGSGAHGDAYAPGGLGLSPRFGGSVAAAAVNANVAASHRIGAESEEDDEVWDNGTTELLGGATPDFGARGWPRH